MTFLIGGVLIAVAFRCSTCRSRKMWTELQARHSPRVSPQRPTSESCAPSCGSRRTRCCSSAVGAGLVAMVGFLPAAPPHGLDRVLAGQARRHARHRRRICRPCRRRCACSRWSRSRSASRGRRRIAVVRREIDSVDIMIVDGHVEVDGRDRHAARPHGCGAARDSSVPASQQERSHRPRDLRPAGDAAVPAHARHARCSRRSSRTS